MYTRTIVCMLALCSLGTSCTPEFWARKGTTSSELRSDLEDCSHEAQRVYPGDLYKIESLERQRETQIKREEIAKSCMKTRGYRRQRGWNTDPDQ